MQFYDKIPGESMDTNVYLSIKKNTLKVYNQHEPKWRKLDNSKEFY